MSQKSTTKHTCKCKKPRQRYGVDGRDEYIDVEKTLSSLPPRARSRIPPSPPPRFNVVVPPPRKQVSGRSVVRDVGLSDLLIDKEFVPPRPLRKRDLQQKDMSLQMCEADKTKLVTQIRDRQEKIQEYEKRLATARQQVIKQCNQFLRNKNRDIATLVADNEELEDVNKKLLQTIYTMGGRMRAARKAT